MSTTHSLPSSAREAKLVGSQYYHTGVPCVHGHVSKRLTATRGCYECHLGHVNKKKQKKKNKPTGCKFCTGICEQRCVQ